MSQEMMHAHMLKDQLGHFGRVVSLLLNRAMMYQKSHPLIKESIDNVCKVANGIFDHLSPVVFNLNRGQFFVEEEPLDPRINVSRTVDMFKAVGIQSISFEKGLTNQELSVFLDLYATLTKASQIEELKKGLSNRGVFYIKVNHVTYQKVTEDDQVVSREALKRVTPLMDADDQENRKKFLDALMESVLSEELSKTLSINSLMQNPGAVSKQMIETDLAGARQLSGSDEQAKVGEVVNASDSGVPTADEGEPGAGVGLGGGTGSGQGSGPDDSPLEGSGMGPGGANDTPFEGDTLALESGQGGFYGEGDAAGRAASHLASEASPAGAHVVTNQSTSEGTVTVSNPALETVEGTPVPSTQGNAGHLLIHQLEIMQQEVERQLRGEGDGDVNLSDLAFAIFDMKKQLLESIQTQKTLGVAYANEAAIVESANQLTDKVIIELIKEEYNSGKISTQRLAMIIRRLIPEAKDLKRLMPKIKVALLASGMSMEDYSGLVQEMQNELQNEELSRILQESSEAIGIDGDHLIAEFKRNPTQAAELIYLASEIRAGTGDASALTSILVEYVEKLGGQLAQDSVDNGDEAGQEHLKDVVSEVESGLLHQLSRMKVDTDLLTRMEARINDRMEAILDKMRVEWLQSQSAAEKKEGYKMLSVLQTLENNCGDDEQMEQILKVIRKKSEEGEIEENDFSQIYTEINLQVQHIKDKAAGKRLNAGVLQSDELIYLLEKEIAKANRYQTFFSVLAFSFVSAKPKVKTAKNVLSNEAVLEAALDELTQTFRKVDFVGQIGKNKMLAILPMTSDAGAKMALSRVLRVLHAEPILVNNVPVQLRVAGVVATYDRDSDQDARAFAKHLSNQLMDMVSRVKSIQVLF